MAIVWIRKKVIGLVSVNFGGKENYVIDVSFTKFFSNKSTYFLLESDNGKQVIILSCVVGLLISTLFIFRIGRIIYKKRKETKIQ